MTQQGAAAALTTPRCPCFGCARAQTYRVWDVLWFSRIVDARTWQGTAAALTTPRCHCQDVLWTAVHIMLYAIVVCYCCVFGDQYYGADDVLSDEVVVCDHDGHGHREPAAC